MGPGIPIPPGHDHPHLLVRPVGHHWRHTCENIAFPQLLLQAVTTLTNWTVDSQRLKLMSNFVSPIP